MFSIFEILSPSAPIMRAIIENMILPYFLLNTPIFVKVVEEYGRLFLSFSS